MKVRWRILVPAVGLLLFSLGSYTSFAHPMFPAGRYFWWASIRLDSDPLGKRFPRAEATKCKEGEGDCLVIEPTGIWVDPGWMAKILVISGTPAFLAGSGIVHLLASLGVSEVTSFMISMPVLIVSWFYVVGWAVDRWIRRPSA